MDRLTEMEQKVSALQAKLDAVDTAILPIMRMYEEVIILTDKWAETIHPYVIGDRTLIERKDTEVKRINSGLKKAKHRFRSAMSG